MLFLVALARISAVSWRRLQEPRGALGRARVDGAATRANNSHSSSPAPHAVSAAFAFSTKIVSCSALVGRTYRCDLQRALA
eukprot:3086199-Pyramimonas_sp.AAC.1